MTTDTQNSEWYDSKAWPTVISTNDYYPFGLQMAGRKMDNADYRYGFNGKEIDNWNAQGEAPPSSGGGPPGPPPDPTGDPDVDPANSSIVYDYGFRIYNPTIAKFLSVDPLASSFAWNSPYSYAENDVIRSIDLEGGEKLIVNDESVQNFSSFFFIIQSDEVLRKTVLDPINNPELKDKIHIYLVQVNEFGYQLGTVPDGANYKFSTVASKVEKYINYKNGVEQEGYTKQRGQQDEEFFKQAGLDPYLIKSKIDKGIKVHIVAVGRRDKLGTDETFETMLHEFYLHTRKFESSDNDIDHIEGFGEEYYSDPNNSPRYSPESWKVPESTMGKLWLRFKTAQQKIEDIKNEN